jgi:ferritin-like metal-binding protein YciE
MAKALHTLQELLEHELQDLYDAEHQLTKALPKMAEAATSTMFRNAFKKHLTQTEEHIQRLEQAFEALGKKATRKPCKAMKGLIAEGEETMEEKMDAPVMDAALIASAQRVEHYEIAGYGTVCTFAKVVGYPEIATLLSKTLEEEKATDETLTGIAETVNEKASTPSKSKAASKK